MFAGEINLHPKGLLRQQGAAGWIGFDDVVPDGVVQELGEHVGIASTGDCSAGLGGRSILGRGRELTGDSPVGWTFLFHAMV